MSRHESVPLANARADLETLERTNDAIEANMRARDTLYNIMTAKDGRKLEAVFSMVVAKLIYALIERHKTLQRDGRVATPDRKVSDQQLASITATFRAVSQQNDSWSRTTKLAFFMYGLIRLPELRGIFITDVPPQHPFPESAEAESQASGAIANANGGAVVAWLQNHLLPAYMRLMTDGAQRVSLSAWVVDAVAAYAAYLPLDLGK